MSRTKSIAAIAALFAMVMVGAVAWAQSTDRDSCVDACQRAQDRCIDTCGTHDDPVECEENCQETAEDCSRQCR